MKEIIGNYVVNNPIFWLGLFFIFIVVIFIKNKNKETKITRVLKQLDKEKYIVLKDIKINTFRKNHIIDTIILSKYGIFVIKYVNMDGKIYGDEREIEWIQLKDSKKTYFDNPCRQLHSDVRVIADVLDLSEKYFVPIVCFTEDVNLSLEIKDKVTQIDFLDDVIRTYKKEIIKYGLSEITDKIISIKDVPTSNIKDNDTKDNSICPKCGGKLILRNGKYGDFIGCSNYPNCKYTREI